MPDNRYALRNGDKTSTDGVLVATGRSVFHHATTIGVEGDYATCPACKAGGPVMNDCYPAFDVDGKQVLVSGARVYCKCPTKPIVLPSERDFVIEVNRGGGGYTQSEGFSHTNNFSERGNYDEQFRIVGEDGHPIPGVPYYIKDESGNEYKGVSDENGNCPRVYTNRQESLLVVIGIAALERWKK